MQLDTLWAVYPFTQFCLRRRLPWGLPAHRHHIPESKTGSCLEELICMRDKKTTTGNERETMTKKWTWIPHRDMASNEPRRHVQKIRLTGTPKWSELWNCSTMEVKHGCLAWTRCIHLFEAWLKPPVYMCFLRILNKIQVLGMLMTNQILFIKRF